MESEQYKNYNRIQFYLIPKVSKETYTASQYQKLDVEVLKDFRKNVAIHKGKGLCESDVRPINKTIAKHYNGAEPPKLHTCFLILQVDFHPERGYSSR